MVGNDSHRYRPHQCRRRDPGPCSETGRKAPGLTRSSPARRPTLPLTRLLATPHGPAPGGMLRGHPRGAAPRRRAAGAPRLRAQRHRGRALRGRLRPRLAGGRARPPGRRAAGGRCRAAHPAQGPRRAARGAARAAAQAPRPAGADPRARAARGRAAGARAIGRSRRRRALRGLSHRPATHPPLPRRVGAPRLDGGAGGLAARGRGLRRADRREPRRRDAGGRRRRGERLPDRAGRRRVEERFAVPRMVEGNYRVYETVLRARGA